MADPERPELLLELLKLHTDEVRFQVTLNWDRAKSSLTFHAGLLALVGTFSRTVGHAVTLALFAFAGLSALACARLLVISHGYYQAARDRRAEIEKRLGVDVMFGTTPTQRGESRRGFARVRIVDIVTALHCALAILAFVCLAVYWQ